MINEFSVFTRIQKLELLQQIISQMIALLSFDEVYIGSSTTRLPSQLPVQNEAVI
jgi:hypothetical protein